MSNKEQKKPSMEEALGNRMKPLQEHQQKIDDAKMGKALGKRMNEQQKIPTAAEQELLEKESTKNINPAEEKFKKEYLTEPLLEEQTEDEIVEQALVEAQSETRILNQETPQGEPSPPVKSSEPVETIPVQTETMMSTNNPPAKEQPTIPALSIDPLHATKTSTPESVEPLMVNKVNKILAGIPNASESAEPLTEKKLSRLLDQTDLTAGPIPFSEAAIRGMSTVQVYKDINLRRLIEFVHSNDYSLAWVQLHITSISSIPKVFPSPTLWDVPNDVDIAALVYQIVLTAGFVENTWPYLRLIMGTSRDNVDWTVAVLTTCALFQALQLLPYTVNKAKEHSADT